MGTVGSCTCLSVSIRSHIGTQMGMPRTCRLSNYYPELLLRNNNHSNSIRRDVRNPYQFNPIESRVWLRGTSRDPVRKERCALLQPLQDRGFKKDISDAVLGCIPSNERKWTRISYPALRESKIPPRHSRRTVVTSVC